MVELMVPSRSSGMVDPGWQHGVPQDDRKKKVKCNYCGKVVSGGIYRLKQHLARVSGEVTYCEKAPEEVYLRMKDNLEGTRLCKKAKLFEDDGQTCLNFPYEYKEDHDGYACKGKQLADDRNMIVNFTPVRSSGYADPGWEHGVPQDERKKKVKCNYCEKVVSGGINRFKQHLARIPGEVAPCKNAPEDVYHKIKENMKWHRSGKRQRHPDTVEICTFPKQSNNEDEDEDEVDEKEQYASPHLSKDKFTVASKSSGKVNKMSFNGMASICGPEPLLRRSRLDSFFLNLPNDQISPSCRKLKVKNRSRKKSRKEVISSICKFFYHAGVPLQAANSVYFHKMLELVGQYGQGLAGPQSQVISGHFLQQEIAIIRNYLVEYKAFWGVTGCSIMADSWKDIEGRTLINLLVSSPRGVYFFASVNASDMVQDAPSLFKLLDKVVEEMGEENIVQVITENTPSYKAAGKMLEEKRRNLFWTPCATHCINQVLEEFVKIQCVQECMVKGQKITKLIHKSVWVVNLMKEFSRGHELLRPAATRYASSFATLQSLLDHKTGLQRMFRSSQWLSSIFSKSDGGKEVQKIVSNNTFWKNVQYVCRSVEPVLQVLQKLVNGENLSMPCLYNDMHKAKRAIKLIHGDDKSKYEPFCNVLDNYWSSLLHHPLYMAAYYLNPSYRYHPEFMAHSEVVRGLKECIHRLEPDNIRRMSASRQVSDYNSAKGDFGTELAINTRTELDPAAWWQQHGISCLELQRVAVRILSQTCFSVGCEHSWSIYDQIHSQSQNRLAQKRLDDLIFVHYNLRLRECQLKKRSNNSTFLDGALLEHLLDDWIVEAEKDSLQENEEIQCNVDGTAYGDGYENDLIDYLDGTMETQNGTPELVTVADTEPMDVVNLADAGVTTDNDHDQNFFNNDLSD